MTQFDSRRRRADCWLEPAADLPRRQALGLGALVPGAAHAAQPAARAAALPARRRASGRDLYTSLGVRPIINARGTLTIIGGSMELPEVRAAKAAANQQYVNLEELMDAAGKRLAELTGAEWGMVSSGCAAAMSHATAACVAGGNPDLHVRIPDLRGFAKTEVIIPGHSRNVYDAAIRAVGVTIVEAEHAGGTRARDRAEDRDDLRLRQPAQRDRPDVARGDRAHREATRRADHGRCRRRDPDGAEHPPAARRDAGRLQRRQDPARPQSAGVLLGRKDLVQAAWIHSAPHHGYARAMKVGREEVVGMLVASSSG